MLKRKEAATSELSPAMRQASSTNNAEALLAASRLELLRSLRQGGVPEHVVAAFAAVPRERFVPAPLRAHAYEDRPLALGEEQTISQPYMIARMLIELDLRPEDRVLDIGTGSGYQAALLGCLCRQVFSVEVRPALLERAQRTLDALGYRNVHTFLGDGRQGLAAYAPFDVIICAAATDDVPPALVAQLAPGGRLALPVGDKDQQRLWVGRKPAAGVADDTIQWQGHEACTFVPLVRA